MRKTLIPIGNSLGFVVERPILDLLKWGRETVFELSTDGRRLTLEPVEANPEVDKTPPANPTLAPAPDLDFSDPKVSAQIVDGLVSRFHMDNERFRRLHHARNYSNTFKAHRDYSLAHNGRFQAGGTNEITARRLHACFQALERGETWEAAIAQAMQACPR